MRQEIIQLGSQASDSPDFSRLVVSLRGIRSNDMRCETIVGYPGLPNVNGWLGVGDAILYETPEDGLLEVRVSSLNAVNARFLISEVSARRGLAAGFVSSDPYNSPFSLQERARISESILQVRAKLEASNALAAEQLALVARKLDEIEAGAARFGRKDWIAWAGGTISALCISAAFAPEVTRSIFEAMSSAFAWLFTGAVALLR